MTIHSPPLAGFFYGCGIRTGGGTGPCKLDFIRMLRFQELLQMQQHDFGMAWRSEFSPRKRHQLSKM
ncbi:hypothetical protein CRM82_03625 [Comamonas terrigena]|uniref:Uncharacterized protein n=1 Tax=Comamonas terrigena TaxID=32013 RepID=A0A2A7URP2_COMTR|nr:hypothetical protein CRM82_03625 [Comamonas terrigena]